MKVLIRLDISENEIGDVGISEIIRTLKDFSSIEYLDISGNGIGKTKTSLG